MALNKKDSSKVSAMAVGIIIGVLVSVLISLVASVILAGLIGAEKMSMGAVEYGSAVILMMASAAGSFTACRKVNHHRTQVCLMTGGAYYLLLLAITSVFYEGKFQGLGITAVSVILGCAVVALLGIRDKKTRKNKFKKSAFC